MNASLKVAPEPPRGCGATYHGAVTVAGDSRPTLRDVADRAQVSTTSVSLALRNQPGVSSETRETIMAAAQELGYTPGGRGAAHQGRKTVGVLLRDIVSVFSHGVMSGIQSAAAEHGIQLHIADGRGDDATIQDEFDKLTRQSLHGIIVFGTAVSDTALRVCAEQMPVILVGRKNRAVSRVDIVSNDDVTGARTAVRHLLSEGHTNIAHLSKGVLRRDGYVQEMKEAGLELQSQVEGGTPELVKPAIRYLLFSILHEKNAPTAVFAETDGLAIDMIGAALDAGLRVPEDLSVMGYDSTRQCEMIRPRLTSVGQPRYDMGVAAVNLLLSRWEGRSADRHVMLKPSLDVRESTAPPRQQNPSAPVSVTTAGPRV